MGSIYQLSCERCGYTYEPWLGDGLGYNHFLGKSIASFKNGEHGEFCKLFFEDSPNGILDCTRVLLQCKNCRALDNDLDYSMYIPVEKDYMDSDEAQIQTAFSHGNGDNYLFLMSEMQKYGLKPDTFGQKYKLYSKYEHRCKICGGEHRVIREVFVDVFDSPVFCPKCNTIMKIGLVGGWD